MQYSLDHALSHDQTGGVRLKFDFKMENAVRGRKAEYCRIFHINLKWVRVKDLPFGTGCGEVCVYSEYGYRIWRVCVHFLVEEQSTNKIRAD